MKKMFISLIALMFLVVACAPQTPVEPPSLIAEQPEGMTIPADQGELLSPVEDALVKQLTENLGLKIGVVSVISDDNFEFSDACLGVVMQDVMCAQVIMPGHIIILEANRIRYEYHTNADGSQIQPATLALTWSRDGGIAGFCDRLTVFLSGEVYGNRCDLQDGKVGTFASLLSADQREQFDVWVERYGQVDVDASDPKGVSDRMMNRLILYGNGSVRLKKADEEALFKWAQDLFQKLYN